MSTENTNANLEALTIEEAARQRNFAHWLSDVPTTHEGWLDVMHFGRQYLLDRPHLLLELLIRHAQKENAGMVEWEQSIPVYMRELGLKIVSAKDG